jgi:hypothetical protein
MSNYNDQLFVNQEKKVLGFQKLLQPATRQAVMLIEAPKDMGKTWLVGRMQRHCQNPAVNIPVAQIDFRNPREIHDIQDFLGLLRLLRNKLAQPDYFDYFNATINEFTGPRLSAGGGLATLRQNIEKAFILEEIKDLCFDLDIIYDNLPGETLSAKARELVSYCQRYGILRNLIEQCVRLRGQVDWWRGLEHYREGEMGNTAEIIPTVTADSNAPFRADSEMERRRAERLLNDAFFECVTRLMADRGQLVFLFDSYEAAPPEIDRWLRAELLPRLRDGQLAQAVVIVTGRKTPDLTELNMRNLLVQTGLDPFTEEYVREYFEERRQITGLDLRTIILTSGGIPGALAMMADYAQATSKEDDDFFSDL